MPDSARIAQATVLEVPVTIQGSQRVEGTERREMFTETTKTTLVFENGAAVLLKARVLAGQSVFLRNELSGKEVLCRVIEVPSPGQLGPTELEFTIREPGFWEAPAEQPAAAAPEPQKQEPPRAVAESMAVTPGAESGTSTSAPASAAGTPTTLTSSHSPEAPAISSEAPAAAEPDDAKDAEQLAGIVAKDARIVARRTAAKKPAKEATPNVAAEQAETTSQAPPKAEAFSALALRLHGIRTYTLRKNPIAFGVAGCALVAAVVGLAWNIKRSLSIHPVNHPSAAVHFNAAAMAPQAPKAQPPAPAQEHSVQLTKYTSAAANGLEAAGGSRRIESSAISTAPRPEGSDSARNSALPASEFESRPKQAEPIARHVIPGRILSQTQPPLPSWAKALEVANVVQLDAVIDEKGNVASATQVSGPRLLENAARDAVDLWIFEPTLVNGKPIPTHMILTVEFQR